MRRSNQYSPSLNSEGWLNLSNGNQEWSLLTLLRRGNNYLTGSLLCEQYLIDTFSHLCEMKHPLNWK